MPITPQLLEPFDAVITVGRTVLLATAMGKPTYLCDIHGTEGWLVRDTYEDSRLHSFSGRRLTVEDWGAVEEQLLDTAWWPDAEELAWLRERIAQDHALSRRVAELGSFFAETIEKASPPSPHRMGTGRCFACSWRREATGPQDVSTGASSSPGARSRTSSGRGGRLPGSWRDARRGLGRPKRGWRVAGSGYRNPTENSGRSVQEAGA